MEHGGACAPRPWGPCAVMRPVGVGALVCPRVPRYPRITSQSSYRRARRDLFDGSSCPLIARRGYSEDELRHDVVKKDDTHAWEKVYRTSQLLAFNMLSNTISSSRFTSGTSPESLKASFAGSQSTTTLHSLVSFHKSFFFRNLRWPLFACQIRPSSHLLQNVVDPSSALRIVPVILDDE